ncbi:hypothetical protein [Parapedobacter tibetensis]|uniref:hypothetical protein n=1 Tax=Parapedobacter tibetensis TaxID=2972951 RepID=UPI00214D67FB|nr:hypothetical protein [Parapedobacter tibetensis]
MKKTDKTEKIYQDLMATHSAKEVAESFVFPSEISKKDEKAIALAILGAWSVEMVSLVLRKKSFIV